MRHVETDKYWSVYAASRRLDDKTVGVKLGRGNDGRLTLEITERNIGRHVFLEETEKDTLHFKTIRELKKSGRRKDVGLNKQAGQDSIRRIVVWQLSVAAS